MSCVATDPQDAYAWFKLLELASFWQDDVLLGRLAASAAAALLGHPTLVQTHMQKIPHVSGDLLAYLSLGLFPRARCDAHEAVSAVAFLDTWRSVVCPSPRLFYVRGCFHEVAGQWRDAQTAFRACLTAPNALSGPDMAYLRPQMGLIRVALASGRRRQAQQMVRTLLREFPKDPETQLCARFLDVTERASLGDGPRPLSGLRHKKAPAM